MVSLNTPLVEAANNLVAHQLGKGYQLEAIHEYTNADGQPLYWRIRLRHSAKQEKYIRPMQCKAGNYELSEPKYPEGKPLYRQHEFSLRPNETIVVCEGEWCADKLASLGVLVTTSGSATSAEKANWQPLAGRKVLIWPDNDKEGQQYAMTVFAMLKPLNCDVQYIDVDTLNVPYKGDAVDWLAQNSTATHETILSLPTINQNFSQEITEEEIDDKQSQASGLVAFVKEHMELFHDKNGEVYAQDKLTRETKRLESKQFKDWLLSSFYNLTNKTARDQAAREALNTLAGLARYAGNCREVFIRVAVYENEYYIDLAETGKSRAIRLTAGHWEIVDNPPVCFLRPESIRTMPTPVSGGNISKLWEFINIPEEDRLLVATWIIDCWRPDSPFPLLELIGEQGSAKSTTQNILRQLIDPNGSNLRAAPKNSEDIFISAGVNWLMSYENISYLSPSIQDTLCIIATGGGHAKRKLYSDAEESIISVQRPLVLNGISIAVSAQDLVDRTISIEIPTLIERKETKELWTSFEVNRPTLLGALLDIAAKALELLPAIQLPIKERPRLIEFAKLGTAIAKAIGKSEEEFLQQFKNSRSEAIARTIDSNPVAAALIEWFEHDGRKKHKLPLKELLKKVERHKPLNIDTWPRSPKGFGDALRRAAPALRQMDIQCRSLGKTGSYISWEVGPKE